jgi:hypothetical protein
MAVCAHHLAFSDLVEDALPVAFRDPLTDIERLLAEMIKLEDDRIAFAAVHAGIRFEVLDQVAGSLKPDLLPI